MIIRAVNPDDAEAYLSMLLQLDNETNMMMFEPGERKDTPNQIRKKICHARSAGSLILIVENNHSIIGFLSAERGFAKRIRHSAYVVVGILSSHRGKGLGQQLFQALDQWAAENGIRKLELTVLSHNNAGVQLYKKMGYEIEGVKRMSMLVDGCFHDELYMGKIIKPNERL
jgi:RimJ/RimL family protein N-acetyltransferase